MAIQKVLIIIPRYGTDLEAFLQRKFAGDSEVVLLRDRRVVERRQHRFMMHHPDRRRTQRRNKDLRFLGLIVPVRKVDE